MEHPPLIDLSAFGDTRGVENNEKEEASTSLRNACRDIGFFYVKSDTVNNNTTDDVIKTIKEFFDLPDDVKSSANASNSPLFRGYQGVTSPSHSCAPDNKHNIMDLKESFSIGATGNASAMHGENQWPSKCPLSIKKKLEAHWNTMMKLTMQVVRCLALSLGLDEDFFLIEMNDPIAQMVCFRYPPSTSSKNISNGDSTTTGCSAHTDCGFLTLLIQEKNTAPLQVKNINNVWVDVPQVEGYVLCNLGGMAERWSNQYYRSSWHRVNVNTSNNARHSIPFFCNLNYSAVVDPAESVCKGQLKCSVGEPKFPSVLAGDYICEKLNLMYMCKNDSEQNVNNN